MRTISTLQQQGFPVADPKRNCYNDRGVEHETLGAAKPQPKSFNGKASAMAGNTVAFGLPSNELAHGARILMVCSAEEEKNT